MLNDFVCWMLNDFVCISWLVDVLHPMVGWLMCCTPWFVDVLHFMVG